MSVPQYSKEIKEVLKHVNLPFAGNLHEYQVTDITRACQSDSFGFMHEMGLGKTVMSALVGCYKLLKEDFHSVYVLCPASLITQWVGVLTGMGVSVAAYRGTPAVRRKIDTDVDFLVMSYQIFQKDYDTVARDDVYYIIDEATVMCNTQNLLFKMLQGGRVEKVTKKVSSPIPLVERIVYEKKNKGCCLLTATPINKPEDSYGLIKTITPLVYNNYSQFERIHVAEKGKFEQITAYANLELLKENLLLQASLRSAEDHLKLPPIVYKTVYYDLDPKHKSLYDKLIEEKILFEEGEVLIDALQAQALYNYAQKLVLNPDLGGYKKEPAALELLDMAVKSVKNYMVFCNYRASNTKLMERYKVGGIFGDTTRKHKEAAIEAFKAGKASGLAVNPKSGGVGLDLPMCSHQFYPELPITPRDFRQAVGRVHRQGQQSTVVITVFVALGTIQHTLFKKIMEKDDLVAEVIDTPRSLRSDLLDNTKKVDSKKTKEDLMKELRGE